VDEGTEAFGGVEFGTAAAAGAVLVPNVAPGWYVDGGDVGAEGVSGESGVVTAAAAGGGVPDGPGDEGSPRTPVNGDAGGTSGLLGGATVAGGKEPRGPGSKGGGTAGPPLGGATVGGGTG
jgi:hypothetical protein